MKKPILKSITFFHKPAAVGCDAKCSKAWGLSQRPKVQLSDDEDDVAWLADDEVGEAPADPGTYEGGHAKPRSDAERLNKWCVRECERCVLVKPGEVTEIRDFSTRLYNQPSKHPEPTP